MTKFLLILLSLFVTHDGFAQKTFFSDTSNQWVVDYHVFDPGIDKKYDVFYQLTDAIEVAGKQYLILKSHSNSMPSSTALIREDTTEKKVYARSIWPNDTSEHLLYNYNLVPGDTFLMYRSADTIRHYVSAMSILSVNGTTHKLWQLTHITPNMIDYQVVEGLGCLRDPLTPYNPIQPFGIGWYLKCFSNAHAFSSTNNPTWYTTNCVLAVDDPVLFSNEIKVYPNPARGELNITWPVAAKKAWTVTVYDQTGRMIVQLVPARGQQKVTLNTSEWTNGIYTIKASSEEGSITTARVVIQN